MMKRFLRKLLGAFLAAQSRDRNRPHSLLAQLPLSRSRQFPVGERGQCPETAFTSTIARGLSLVAIVVSGLTFAFGEGGSKRVLAGVLFGVGMAIAAVNFLAWLFPGA